MFVLSNSYRSKNSTSVDADLKEDNIDPDQNGWLNELGIWIT
jgi:hypothetical protein